MEKQMALFKVNSKKQNDQNIKLSKADKIYLKFPKGLATQLNIFQGGEPCQSIALDYVNDGTALGEEIEMICKRSNQTHPHHYYHYVDHKFLQYDSWLLKMVLKSEIHQSSKKADISNK